MLQYHKKLPNHACHLDQVLFSKQQGCILSSSLFNLYTKKIFREMEDMKGVMVGGVNINKLRYADDTVLVAESTADIQELINAVNEKKVMWDGNERRKNKINGRE